MPENPFEGDVEDKLEKLAEDPPTIEEAKERLEASGRYENVEIVSSDENESEAGQSDTPSN